MMVRFEQRAFKRLCLLPGAAGDEWRRTPLALRHCWVRAAPKAFHAPAGRAFFFGGAQKRSKKGRLHEFGRPRFDGKNLINSGRLHAGKDIRRTLP